MEVIGLIAGGRRAAVPRALGLFLVLPCLAAGLVWLVAGLGLPMAVQAVLAVVVVLPVAPLLDRVVFRPVADGSVLLLLMMSVVLHFALAGVGLMFFGPEGVRTDRMTDYVADFGPVSVSGQMMLIAAAAALFSLLLYLFFDFTVTGKALRATAVNRTGARLVGIRPERAGTIAYLVGSLMAGVAGVLIAPVDTMFYDSGFLLGLLAFVGATIGGLANYPGTAAGALLIGLLGSFASFYSSAFKEVLVFSVLIPVLIWRSVAAGPSEEEPEE
jgi:branched-chain amino acid transport system permease protein